MKNIIVFFIGLIIISLGACTGSTNSSNHETPGATHTDNDISQNTNDTKVVETEITQAEEDKSLAEAVATTTEEKVVDTKKKADTAAKKAKEETKPAAPSKAKEKVKEVVNTVKETTKETPVVKKVEEVVKETVQPVTPTPVQTKPKEETKPVTTVKPEEKKPEPEVSTEMPPAPTKPALSHDKWDALLRKHVSSSGKVNYAGFKADKAQLASYLEILSANTPESGWSKNKIMAYWINAYNAFTVKLILDNYPVSSITDLEGGKPWSKRWISLGNQTYSLDQIEKEILLKKYKDARVHFAVNCAAKSCPALLNKAWTASNLESNFEKQTKAFINNSQFNELSAKSAKVSQLFNWYASDFGDVKTFINKYANTQLKSNAKIDFLEYDWKLNN